MANKAGYKIEIVALIAPDMNNPETIGSAHKVATEALEAFEAAAAKLAKAAKIEAHVVTASANFHPNVRVPDPKPEPKAKAEDGAPEA